MIYYYFLFSSFQFDKLILKLKEKKTQHQTFTTIQQQDTMFSSITDGLELKQNYLQCLKKLTTKYKGRRKKKYNLLKEASMQLDEPVWECQTNSISVILLLKEKSFVRTKETTINQYTQIYSN